MTDAHPIHEIIRRAEEAGVSLNAICRESGVARSTITRMKNHDIDGRHSTIQKLEAALNVTISASGDSADA